MQTLLEKVGIIDYKYEKLREQNNFNVFSILRSKSDEVNLHSRFIAELLNPNGSHKQGSIFLNAFLEICGLEPAYFHDVVVEVEYKKIDILIWSKLQSVIIENKIWAGDQEEQLDRYYNTLLNEGNQDIKVIYLTLDGREPSEYSLGQLSRKPDLQEFLIQLSYKNEINKWLENCIKEAAQTPVLRETIIQYKNLIGELTGNSMSKEERHEVINLLSQNDNVLKAKKIVDNWIHVKWHTEWIFGMILNV